MHETMHDPKTAKTTQETTQEASPLPARLLIMDRDPNAAVAFGEMLGQRDQREWSCTFVASLAGVLKSIKTAPPRALIVRTTANHSANPSEFGCDHVVRVLRQIHPHLPIVITAADWNRRVEAIRDEFDVPCLIEPLDAAELFAALRYCGVFKRSGQMPSDREICS